MATRTTADPKPPADLTKRSRTLWASVLDDYDLTVAEIELLTEACRSLDRADQARESINELGPVVLDRYGSPKANPACDVEARCRAFYAAAVRQLGLRETEPPALSHRGPTTYTRRRR